MESRRIVHRPSARRHWRSPRPHGVPAQRFREALRTGQSNGRKAASPVRQMSCLRASPRGHMRRVPRKRLSLVHQRQPDTGAVKATPHTMARAAPTSAPTVTKNCSPSTRPPGILPQLAGDASRRQLHQLGERTCGRPDSAGIRPGHYRYRDGESSRRRSTETKGGSPALRCG